jgi:hypothetical protein
VKPVMDWVKSNVAVVVLSAVIILVLPLAFVGSTYWSGKIKKSRQNAVTQANNDLNALRVTYTLNSPLPGGAPITKSADVPNSELTKFFKEKKQAQEQQVGQVVTIAEEINRKKPLMEGFFPDAAGPDKRLEMAYLVVGGRGNPSVYEKLLKSINAGGPADPNSLAQSITELKQQMLDKVRSESGREQMSQEEQEETAKQLAGHRLAAYREHASEISVYATADCLPGEVPQALPSEPPPIEQCFRWQWDYWVIEDLLRAVEAANTSDGRRQSVLNAPIKRVERITLSPMGWSQGDPNVQAQGGPAGPASITGRQSGGGGGLYDIRNAELTLVVASERLPEVMNAISRTNFMTVTGMSISSVDDWTELEDGYYYGTDHVVRVRIPVETVWLRSWTVPLMPQRIKEIVTNTAPVEAAPAAEQPMTPRASATPPPASKPSGKKKKEKSTKRPGTSKGGGGDF